MVFREIRILLWKHYRLRKYRWFLTLVEVLLPIGIILLANALTRDLGNAGMVAHSASESRIYTKNDITKFGENGKIYYTPTTPFTNRLMRRVAKRLGVEIKVAPNEPVMEIFLRGHFPHHVDVENNVFGVVFQDLPDETPPLPDKLRYKIRNTNKWSTQELYSGDDESGPNTNVPYLTEGFCAIQLAIDEAFIKIKSKGNYEEFLIQGFPYPEYTEYTRHDSPRSLIPYVVCFVIVITSLISSISLIHDIIDEKENGSKELMKIAGVHESEIWICWFLGSLIVSAVPCICIATLLKFPFNGHEYELLYFTDFSIILVFIFLYCAANITYSFLFCSLFRQGTAAISVYAISMGIIVLSVTQIRSFSIPFIGDAVCIFPVGAFIQAFMKIRFYEMQGIRLDWSSASACENNPNYVSLIFLIYMLVFDIFFYFLLTLIVISVNPGKFGVKKLPFGLPSLKRFILRIVEYKRNSVYPLENMEQNNFFERPPLNTELTLQIKDLNKEFGPNQGLKNVNLNIYKGEITALLGHNGSGKTSVFSILTGMMPPTSGRIYYIGMNTFTNMCKFRESLGVCSQENTLFPYLTVLDQLVFYGMLKGETEQEARKEAIQNLQHMGLYEKESVASRSLSGGMQRTLCLLIALMGKPDILVLDEPTSGMDVESRKKLWTLLLELKGNRTIILSTHSVEEADTLADRIAIMNQGSVVCHGSAIFLKKAYGIGYELNITKSKNDTTALTHMILNSIPDTTLIYQDNGKVAYKLPLTDTSEFPTLFRRIESEKEELGVQDIHIACTTMDHIFWKINGAVEKAQSVITQGTSAGSCEPLEAIKSRPYERQRGVTLLKQQFMALFKKKVLYTWRNSYSTFCRISLPSFILVFFVYGIKKLGDTTSSLQLSPSAYPDSMVFMQPRDENKPELFDKLHDIFSEHGVPTRISKNPDVAKSLLSYAREDIISYRDDILLGLAINSTTNRILFNPWYLHSLPIAINTFSNAVLKLLLNNDSVEITTINHPVKIMKGTCDSQDLSIWFYSVWFFVLAFYTLDFSSYFITFQSSERISGFKHIQLMSKVSPVVYYLASFLFDYLFFVLVVFGRIVSFQIIGNSTKFLSVDQNFNILMLIILLFGVCGLLFIYVLSHASNCMNGTCISLFIFNAICAISAVMFYYSHKMNPLFDADEVTIEIVLLYVAKYIILLIPPMNFSYTFIKYMNLWKHNGACLTCPKSLKNTCMNKLETIPYFAFESKENPNGILLELIFSCIEIVLLIFLLTALNSTKVSKMCRHIKKLIFGTDIIGSDFCNVAPDVRAEEDKIRAISHLPVRTESNTMVVYRLRKNYQTNFKSFTAVMDLSFMVRPGECFGLLGVNGAGKTTTFKMLTGAVVPTLGDASIENLKLSARRNEYLSTVGYCPETNCLLDSLTGRETLLLIATLRGVRRKYIANEVEKWICILGLERLQNTLCSDYSAGNKRKLCMAMALIGDPRVVFLDEPTNGVDPVSRQKLYDVINRCKSSDKVVVLSSHSMEECEAICDRLTIMSMGRMKCIGTVPYLKERYAQGFSIFIKISDSFNTEDQIQPVKDGMLSTFLADYCVLKSQQKTSLYYHIKDTYLSWSTLFGRMEKLKKICPTIEDYTISDTTLEDVFLYNSKKEINVTT